MCRARMCIRGRMRMYMNAFASSKHLVDRCQEYCFYIEFIIWNINYISISFVFQSTLAALSLMHWFCYVTMWFVYISIFSIWGCIHTMLQIEAINFWKLRYKWPYKKSFIFSQACITPTYASQSKQKSLNVLLCNSQTFFFNDFQEKRIP